MGKITQGRIEGASRTAKPLDWRKAMSDHVAYALLVYTALQIFLTVQALGEGVSGLLPYLGLVVLVMAIIPLWRWFEARWSDLDDTEAANPAHAAAFRRDTTALWLLAIGLPLGLTVLFKAMFAIF
ncbi:MAG: hypothetical protein ACXIT4_03840 [Erythrobacter sp.]